MTLGRSAQVGYLTFAWTLNVNKPFFTYFSLLPNLYSWAAIALVPWSRRALLAPRWEKPFNHVE